MSEERLYDLALRSLLKECTPAETAELKAALEADPARATEIARFQAEYHAAKELISLVAATETTSPRPTEAVRIRAREEVEKWRAGQRTGNATKPSERPAKVNPAIVEEPRSVHTKRFFWCFATLESFALVVVFTFCRTVQWGWSGLLPGRVILTDWKQVVPWSVLATLVSYFAARWFTRRG